jgi:hypothetical protein
MIHHKVKFLVRSYFVMSFKLMLLAVASSGAIGLGFGLGVRVKPFIFEATETPFGTFVLRYNPAPDLQLSEPKASPEFPLPWYDSVA